MGLLSSHRQVTQDQLFNLELVRDFSFNKFDTVLMKDIAALSGTTFYPLKSCGDVLVAQD